MVFLLLIMISGAFFLNGIQTLGTFASAVAHSGLKYLNLRANSLSSASVSLSV